MTRLGDTLFIFFLSFPILHKQLLMLPKHNILTRTSVQCLGNTQQATLGRIGTQTEEWVSKGECKLYLMSMITDLRPGFGVKGLAWRSRRCRRRAIAVAEALDVDENHQNETPNNKGKLVNTENGCQL